MDKLLKNSQYYITYWESRLKAVTEQASSPSDTKIAAEFKPLCEKVVLGFKIIGRNYQHNDLDQNIGQEEWQSDIESKIEKMIKDIRDITPKVAIINPKNATYKFKDSCDVICNALQEMSKAIQFLGINVNKMVVKAPETDKRDLEVRMSPNYSRQLSAPLQTPNDSKVKALQEYSRQQEQHIRDLKRELNSLTEKLSAEMNSKISHDERNLENISVKKRPMTISEEYTTFCSHIWLEAKNELDKYCRQQNIKEEKSFLFLGDILKVAADCAKEALKQTVVKVTNILEQPVSTDANAYRNANATPNTQNTAPVLSLGDLKQRLPEDLHTAVANYMRTADIINTTILKEELVNLIKRDSKFTLFAEALDKRHVLNYVNEATQLTWLMTIQRPSMVFGWDVSDGKWNEDTQNPHVPGVKVQFYVHPTLYHGDNVMVKGKVYIA